MLIVTAQLVAAQSMSARKAKEAYLRKHGLGTPRSRSASQEGYSTGYSSTEDEGLSPGKPTTPTAKAASAGDKSWSQKRKENLLARASGVRREPDALEVSLTAVSFAAKLKESLKKKAEAKDASEKAYSELTWREKRARNYGLAHGVPVKPPESDVALTSILFAAKLRMRVAGRVAEGDGVVLTSGDVEQAAAAKPKPKRPPGELSWKQQRKEAYLRKYGMRRVEETTSADVAISSIMFAAKLRKKAGESAAASAAAKLPAVAEGSEPVAIQ